MSSPRHFCLLYPALLISLICFDLVGHIDRLRDAVREVAGITPDESLIEDIHKSVALSTRLIIATTSDQLVNIYDTIRLMPHTETKATVRDKEHIAIFDDILVPGIQNAIFIHASDRGVPKVIKIPHKQSLVQHECEMYEEIGTQVHDYALVPVTLLKLENAVRSTNNSPEKSFNRCGIMMPRYACTLGQISLDAAGALACFDRLYRTLVYINQQGWMHGDVKPSNIFIDSNGVAWLGDYGSSVRLNEVSEYTGGTPMYQCFGVDYLTQPLKHDSIGLVLSVLSLSTPLTTELMPMVEIIRRVQAAHPQAMCQELKNKCLDICNSTW